MSREIEVYLTDRSHPLWCGLSEEAYGILFTGKDPDSFVKRFIKGEVTSIKQLQP